MPKRNPWDASAGISRTVTPAAVRVLIKVMGVGALRATTGRQTAIYRIICLALVLTISLTFSPPLGISPVLAASSASRALHGVLDTTFGNQGRAFSNLPPALASSRFSAIERQPDGKLVLMSGINSGSETVIEMRDPQGALDPSFGEGGIAKVAGRFGGLEEGTVGPALQGNEGILYAESNECVSETKVHRLHIDGSPDSGFGNAGGASVLPFALTRLAVDGQNRILVLGTTANTISCGGKSSPPFQASLARLLPSGALDPSFGTDGVVKVMVGEQAIAPTSLVVREDGAIVIGGAVGENSPDLLVALTPDGAPDVSFGTNGVVTVPDATGELLALPGNGLLTSSSYECCRQPNAGVIAIRQYLPGGQLATGFGQGGEARVAPYKGSLLKALSLGPGGSILIAGRTEPASKCKRAKCVPRNFLARLTSSGSLDPGFGAGGWLPLDLNPGSPSFVPEITDLAVAPTGQFYLAGDPGPIGQAFVLGREADGAPSAAFGVDGIVEEHGLVPSNTKSIAAALEPNGETVVFASTNSGSLSGHFALIHFRPNGSLNPSVGSGSGFVPTEKLGIIAPAGGGSIYSLRQRGRVVRIGPDGKEDPAFGGGKGAPLPAAFSPRAVVQHGSKILVAGVEAKLHMAAFQLDKNGRPDRSFGRDGLVVVSERGSSAARAATVDRRGRILLFGAGPHASPQVVRLLPDGRPDRSFGQSGVRLRLPLHRLRSASLTTLPEGGLLIATASPAVGNIHGLRTSLLRLDQSGHVVRSFGSRGFIRVPSFGSPLAVFYSRSQLILAMGGSPIESVGLILRAYRSDGAIDHGFGQNGIVHERSTPTLHFGALAAARQRDGRIVVVGKATRRYGSAETELLRFR